MKFEQVSNQVCGNFVFNAAFDSGNLGKIEIVKQPTDSKFTLIKIVYQTWGRQKKVQLVMQ